MTFGYRQDITSKGLRAAVKDGRAFVSRVGGVDALSGEMEMPSRWHETITKIKERSKKMINVPTNRITMHPCALLLEQIKAMG